MPAGEMRKAMKMDKKVAANRLRFVLLKSLGDAYVTADYDGALLNRILDRTHR